MTISLVPLQRTYYYDAELLQLADFTREQQYIRSLISDQNISIFAPGVVSGLTLSAKGTLISVSVGMGFDTSGVPLFVTQQPAQLDITSLNLANNTYTVQLIYGDNSIGSAANTQQLQQTHVIIEQPAIFVVVPPTPAATGIILGTITVTGGSITATATTGLQTAASLLPTKSAPQSPLSASFAGAPATAGARVGGAATTPTSGAQSFSGPLTVGVGASSNTAQLSVSQDLGGQIDGTSTARFDFVDQSLTDSGVAVGVKTSGGHALISARYSGNDVWELGQDGTARTLSDATLKVDVLPIAQALDRTMALRPVSFAWRSDPEGRRHLGLLAQEVAPVVPEIVGSSSEGRPMLAYQELVPLLVQAIHELADRVVELERDRDRDRGSA